MPTHYRETILAALETSLAQISTGGDPWHTTVVPTVVRIELNVREAVPPLIYIGGQDEAYEIRSSQSTWNLYDRTLTVRLVYYVESTDLTPSTSVSGMLHDIELALADPTLGGVVSDLVIKSNRPLYDENGLPLSGLETIVDIKYRTATNDPTARR